MTGDRNSILVHSKYENDTSRDLELIENVSFVLSSASKLLNSWHMESLILAEYGSTAMR